MINNRVSSSSPVQISFELLTVGSVILLPVLHLGGLDGDPGGGAGAALVCHNQDKVSVGNKSHREQPVIDDMKID